MKPERIFNLIAGLTLLLVGLVALAGNMFLATEAWKLWPLIVVFAGIGLLVPTFFAKTRRGLGSFFMPGIPVLVTGLILLYASITENWEVWAVAWTLEVLALALGFALSSVFMRVPGLSIPAFIVGINGLMFAFCAVTGLWEAWAILWPIEFFAVGLGLLAFGIASHSSGAKTAASILFAIAGGGFFITVFISSFNQGVLKFAVPVMLLVTGALMIGTYLMRQTSNVLESTEPPVVTEEQSA